MLKVIGSGFGRTGTMSMKAALEQLGFPCYHMIECLPHGPKVWKLWEQTKAGDPQWEKIFEGFSATVDFPAATSFKELAEYYPNAKVVHTVRDPASWFDSTQQTIFMPEWIAYLKSSEAGAFMDATIDQYFDRRMHEREHLIECFHRHTEAVKAAIPAENLLIFEVSQGWEPLCNFLEVPVPDGDFPHINDTAKIQGLLRAIIENGFEEILGYNG